jgi:DNA invertase Pin-like site-specific DNA recombinase
MLLDYWLNELAAFSLRKSQVVEKRFFGGLSASDIPTGLNTTEATFRRDWNIARAWHDRRTQAGTPP